MTSLHNTIRQRSLNSFIASCFSKHLLLSLALYMYIISIPGPDKSSSPGESSHFHHPSAGLDTGRFFLGVVAPSVFLWLGTQNRGDFARAVQTVQRVLTLVHQPGGYRR